jgi:hypothetical protein
MANTIHEVFQRGGRIYDQLCGREHCNAPADAAIHQMGEIQRVSRNVSDCPPDLIAFRWAETLSTGEQDVLLASSLRRLQNMIDTAVREEKEGE